MGGIIYKTKQGDMWDYIAWKVYGDEAYVNVLYNANPKYLKVFIFEDGCEIVCPVITAGSGNTDAPEWRDEEDMETDALYGVSGEGDEDSFE